MGAAVGCSPGANSFGDLLTVACKHYSIDISDAELAVFMQQLKRRRILNRASHHSWTYWITVLRTSFQMLTK